MSLLAPEGPVYQAGTLSGNPLAMRAGLAVLACLDEAGSWERLDHAARRLTTALAEEARHAGVPLQTASVGGMLGFFFAGGRVRDWSGAERCDRTRFRRFFHAMLGEGIYLAPSPFEAGFVSLSHGEAELDAFARAARSAMRAA
jgi:glutamate-1-semialdehyde 2,1-aminomutase